MGKDYNNRELAVMYWTLQKKIHTSPRIRKYLQTLRRIMKARQIQPAMLNAVGLEIIKGGRRA